MMKVDIDATIAQLREAVSEKWATHPDTHPVEIACNRDGIDAYLEFVRWTMVQRDKLDGHDLARAAGVMLGQMIVGLLPSFEPECYPQVLQTISISSRTMVLRGIGYMDAHDATYVDVVQRDVGDA